jgi:hypothetical protein
MPVPLKTDMSTKQRQRWSRRRGRDDDGQALIIVLILSVALITMVTFAVSSSIANLNSSGNYANTSQAQLTAYSGLSNATSAMAGQTIGTLPCLKAGNMPLPQTAGGNATYSVTIAYFSDNAATVPLACNGSANTFGTGNPAGTPASAILTSTGTSPRTKPVVMQETVSVAATAQLLPAFAFAMFSPATVQLTSNVAVNQMTGPPLGPDADVYGGTLSECTDGTFIEHNVISYSAVNVNSTCHIHGNLYVQGDVSISNTVQIDGNVYDYGGSVSLTSTPTILGSIYAHAVSGVGGTINANTNAVTVGGSLYATGSITNTTKATIGGSIVPNDTNPAFTALAMPAQVPFPQLNPTPATLSAAGYNVIQVGNTLLGQVSCAVFFLPTTLVSLVNSLLSTKTAIYAPTCTPQTYGLTPFIVSTDMIWVLGGIQTTGTTTFVASPLTLLAGTTYNLSIIVPYGTSCKKGGDINFTNNTEFDPRINVLLYTPCNAVFTVNPSMNGQILARTGISATNQFALNFDNLAAFDVPGASYPLAPVVTVLCKTVSSGAACSPPV